MFFQRWRAERKAREETKRRLREVVITATAIKGLDIPLKEPTEEQYSATASFAIVKKSVEQATEAKRTARGAAQRILGMFEKTKK
jgi:hypothetical protein